jgi:ribosomal protein S27AE
MAGKYAGDDRSKERDLNPAEQAALDRVQAEARDAGATLLTGGKGGLPPSLVLGVMRRDRYRCKRCGGSEGLSMHHKGGILSSAWLAKKGHSMDLNNLATICGKCHDAMHAEARKGGVDSSQQKEE